MKSKGTFSIIFSITLALCTVTLAGVELIPEPFQLQEKLLNKSSSAVTCTAKTRFVTVIPTALVHAGNIMEKTPDGGLKIDRSVSETKEASQVCQMEVACYRGEKSDSRFTMSPVCDSAFCFNEKGRTFEQSVAGCINQYEGSSQETNVLSPAVPEHRSLDHFSSP